MPILLDDLPRDEPLDGKYAIGRRLGQGGMGAVYEATHVGTKRTVAVKVIHPKFSGSPEFVERFRREAEASGRLRHPNVVDVTDFGFAETTTGPVAYLLRRAVTLYSEHFQPFFKLSLLGSVPLIGVTLYIALVDVNLVPGQDMPQLVAFAVLFVGLIGSNLFAYASVTAVTAPLVVQLHLTPLRQPQVGDALSAMR